VAESHFVDWIAEHYRTRWPELRRRRQSPGTGPMRTAASARSRRVSVTACIDARTPPRWSRRC